MLHAINEHEVACKSFYSIYMQNKSPIFDPLCRFTYRVRESVCMKVYGKFVFMVNVQTESDGWDLEK